jgi:hypothetical protein
MDPIMIPMLGISCGLLAIFGGVIVRPYIRYRERRMELEATMVAEKAAQYADRAARAAGARPRARGHRPRT